MKRYEEYINRNPLIQNEVDKENLILLLDAKAKNKHSWQNIFKLMPQLATWLNSKTPLLQQKPKNISAGSSYSWSTKLYWVMHGKQDFETCHVCNKVKIEKNIDSFEKGYYRACSALCAASDPKRQEKTVQTMLKNYGSTNFFTSEAGKKKQKEWCERNGVINAFQLESVKKKSAATRKKHFGYEYTMQSPEKKALAKTNYKEKTGYEHQFSNPEVIAKCLESKQKRMDNGEDLYYTRKIGNRKTRYQSFLKCKEISPLFTEDMFIKLDAQTQYTTLLKWHCNKCGDDFEAFIDQNWSSRTGNPARCMKCHPYSLTCGTSEGERQICDFVKLHAGNDEILENAKKVIPPLELDIVLASKKLAIEYDGLFWHSDTEGCKSEWYHLNKTQLCEAKGIQLIHIFEDEWLYKRQIVESRLKNLLGVYDKTVFARKCEVKEVSPSESMEFQEENHIQGAIGAKVRLGLYFNDELISLMTFGKSRFSNKAEWELLRFCNKLGYHIPGAAGKLLKHFERNWNPKSLISYADRRWSMGKLYEALGFKLDHVSGPDYWYVKNQQRFSRVQFQKHKLRKILPNFDPEKTEVENMLDNDYRRIFDCGNLVFLKEYIKNDANNLD